MNRVRHFPSGRVGYFPEFQSTLESPLCAFNYIFVIYYYLFVVIHNLVSYTSFLFFFTLHKIIAVSQLHQVTETSVTDCALNCRRPVTNLSEIFMVRESVCRCGAVF